VSIRLYQADPQQAGHCESCHQEAELATGRLPECINVIEIEQSLIPDGAATVSKRMVLCNGCLQQLLVVIRSGELPDGPAPMFGSIDGQVGYTVVADTGPQQVTLLQEILAELRILTG